MVLMVLREGAEAHLVESGRESDFRLPIAEK